MPATSVPPAAGIYAAGDLYDAIYRGRGKDYRAEAAVVARHIRRHRPAATSLLDAGCGTGEHLRHFAREFARCEGIDLADGMLEVCRRENPHIPVFTGDMRAFRTGRRYDAVVSLFSAVGNLTGTGELDAALASFAAHLEPGGVVVVEPWWFPDNFTPGHVGASLSEADGRTVARVSHTVREGDAASRMEVHYVVAEPERGVRHFTDTHVMALHTREQYETAFARAGCTVEYVTGEYPGNGLFVGVLGAGR
ncbi:class I SAM-dependent DNA methyltransferase [Streptomyces caatingaensis]|uniref:SAM-dependent methyltransferase n=1 Tax=Streptomyces caatingaensis TaxID=1678637 RepID=A0A0K9XG30_9ACTN|nr:class I SAM-dependent methyltransferase [Streptomyces caatingaensis]KNB52163.1 SAM-dependent methyltransferase [Streptomyces caatingaensis]